MAASSFMPDSGPAAQVCLTFDDGPDCEWTPRVIEVLAAAQVRATFFMIGRSAQQAPALVRRVAAAGHEIGNHTFTHRHPWTMSARVARAEVRDGAAALADIVGAAPRFYRAPHGRNRRCMSEEAQQAGAALVGWNRSAIDWGRWGTAAAIARRLQRVQGAAVVLMHDGRNRHNRPDQLLQVLPRFLGALSERHLQPVTLGEAAFPWS